MNLRHRPLDLYPSTVDGDGTQLTHVRVVVTVDMLRVYESDGKRGARLIASTPHDGAEKLRGAHYQIATPSGTWEVRRAGGCGCGDPLKMIPMRKLPTEVLA